MELEHHKSKKNKLSISLTESAVFLTADVHLRRRNIEQKPTLLRGLLVLHLAKPTKITSIEVDLTATTYTAWPEGIGAHRIEINEVHQPFHASTLYFHASASNIRRAASIGPGISYRKTNNDDDLNNSSILDQPIHTTPSVASPSTNPGTNNEIHSQQNGVPRSSPSPSSPPSFLSQRMNPPMSADRGRPMSLHGLMEGLTDLHIPPIPPYSPLPLPVPSHSSHFPTVYPVNQDSDLGVSPVVPLPSLEDFRHSLYSSSRNRHQSQNPTGPPMDIVQPEPDTNLNTNPPTPISIIITTPPTPSSPIPHPLHNQLSSQQSPRGRKRFSLSAVSNVIIDALQSGSPRTSRFTQSPERECERDRERSGDTTTATAPRGRMMECGLEFDGVENDFEKVSRRVKDKGQGIMAMMLKDRNREEKGKGKAAAVGWKEFKKGTYTFPISFNIPGNAPPTMTCDYGSVSWRLKASVHRPGTFKSKMTAVQEVIVVACPAEEVTEDTENIVVERLWDQQLQYLISVSGRSFYVGGTVPVTFTLMPLASIKIHRLSVFVEERVDYYTNMRRIARTGPIARFPLLSIKGDDDHIPILPLQSADPDALRHSPLFTLIDSSDDLSQVASNLMGPGPWTLHQDLKLPSSCSLMKFTNRNRQSNITVTHILKLAMRVERGDDLCMDKKTGKRKLFDIVVQTPVIILSCRCNPEWTCLPQYSKVLDGSTAIESNCPCRASPDHKPKPLEAARHSFDTCSSVAGTSPVSVSPSSVASLRRPHGNEAIIRTSSLFERLVSGQESVNGEVPPAYDVGSQPATNNVAVP